MGFSGEDWREVSTLDLVPMDSPDLLLLVGGGPAARIWVHAAALATAGPVSCSLGGAAGMEPGRVTDGENALGLPTCTGREVREAVLQTLKCSKSRAGWPQCAQAQMGRGARYHGQRPLSIRTVHVCGSAEAAAALLAAEGGAAWDHQAGAARPRIAVDSGGRWATLREVGLGFRGELYARCLGLPWPHAPEACQLVTVKCVQGARPGACRAESFGPVMLLKAA